MMNTATKVFKCMNIAKAGGKYKARASLSIYKFGLSVCLYVCLYPINVKTAEPIGPKFFVGHLGPSGKVYE